MNVAPSPLYIKMSRTRSKSPGWAAFDLKQRQKQGLAPENNEPFPPMGVAPASLRPCKKFASNNDLPARSVSSIIRPSVNCPTSRENKDGKSPVLVDDSSRTLNNKTVEENSVFMAFKKLKELHCWADNTLIEDIMVAVENDIDKASVLLKAMAAEDNNKPQIKEPSFCSKALLHDNNNLMKADDVSLGKAAEFAEPSSAKFLNDNLKEVTDMNKIFAHLGSIPVEPEWEEDDVYLCHRKDARRMMRLASQHSKAATNAYLKGDHFCAQQYSLKAREEWMAAERLNAKAAKEILSIRNSENDMWKLDLHGLHASEAIQALQERLLKIEAQVAVNRSVSPNRVKTGNGIVRCSSLESLSYMEIEKLDNEQGFSRQRPTSLEVITGKGNHSQGEAALPTAVRSFLNENRYRFDEARLGMITVWPKFRRR